MGVSKNSRAPKQKKLETKSMNTVSSMVVKKLDPPMKVMVAGNEHLLDVEAEDEQGRYLTKSSLVDSLLRDNFRDFNRVSVTEDELKAMCGEGW